MKNPKSVNKVEPKGASSDLASKKIAHRKTASSNDVPKATPLNRKIEVLGVTISHPDRQIFKDPPVTKGELAEFYAAASLNLTSPLNPFYAARHRMNDALTAIILLKIQRHSAAGKMLHSLSHNLLGRY
jgi:hypothetical protein